MISTQPQPQSQPHPRQQAVLVLGGTGFVGRYLIKKLVAAGFTVTVPSRQPHHHTDMTAMSSVQIVDVEELTNLAGHRSGVKAWVMALNDHDALINLVGILNEPKHDGKGFEQAHVVWTQMALEAARQAGIKRYLHMSALAADAANGSSFYLRSKGKAEDWAHDFGEANSIAVTSFCPSVIFGPGDSFLNRFAQLARLMPGFFPLACPGARFAPVYAGDVADQFVCALHRPETAGQRINLCGPTDYSLRELVAYAARTSRHPRVVLGIPDWAARLQARLLEFAPGKPFSRDNYASLQTPSVCLAGCARQSTRMEDIAPQYLGIR